MKKSTYILFDEPEFYSLNNRYPYFGGSPKFISFLKEYFNKYKNEISSFTIAIYLFNNFELHRLFRELAEEGIKINVVSIPLEGYDDTSPQNITHDNGTIALKNKHTKYSLASIIYQNFQEKPLANYNLFIFPHTYIRSPRVKPFSRGKMPYSLHIKSFLIEFKNGEAISGITSSNLAMRDLVKYDTFVMREITGEEKQTSVEFYNHLVSSSVPLLEFSQNKTDPFQFFFEIKKYISNRRIQFISPFYSKSPEIAEKLIIELLKNATKHIWVMAQHISAFDYRVPLNYKIRKQTNAQLKREGFLYTLLEKGKQGIEVTCLSQTYVDESENKGDYRIPMNQYNFIHFIKEYKKLTQAKYFINDAVHSKYIIIDDIVIVSTFNYTPTQFIYLPFVKIDHFENIKGLKYEGIFSEVGQLMILEDKLDIECFKKNFQYLLGKEETKQVI